MKQNTPPYSVIDEKYGTAVTLVDQARFQLLLDDENIQCELTAFFSLSAGLKKTLGKFAEQLKRMFENSVLANYNNPDEYSTKKLVKLSPAELIAKGEELASWPDKDLSENLLLEKTGALSYYGIMYYMLNNHVKMDMVPFTPTNMKGALMAQAEKENDVIDSKLAEKEASLISEFGSLDNYFKSVINDKSLDRLAPVFVDMNTEITFEHAEKLGNKYRVPGLKRILRRRGNFDEFFAEVKRDRKVFDIMIKRMKMNIPYSK